jgi:hypothetical protein
MNSVPERQPDSVGAYSVGLNGEEKAVIELLRTPNLSIEHLDSETKGRIRAVIEELHLRRGISLTDSGSRREQDERVYLVDDEAARHQVKGL